MVLVRSLARRCCTRRSLGRTPLLNTINTSALYAFRLPLMFRSVTKTTRATTERDSGAPTVRYTHRLGSVIVSEIVVVAVMILARCTNNQYNQLVRPANQ